MRDDNLQQQHEQDEQQYLEFAELKKSLHENVLEMLKNQPSKIPSNDGGLEMFTELCETEENKKTILDLKEKFNSGTYQIKTIFDSEE